MPFHFSLQPVLRLRQSYEQREILRLALINGYLNQLRQQYETLDQQKLLAQNDLADRLKSGMTAGEFHFEIASIGVIEQQKRAVLAQIEKMEQQRLAQELAFREAQKKRKILENLRDRGLAAYLQIQNRREQQQVDDLFAQRAVSHI